MGSNEVRERIRCTDVEEGVFGHERLVRFFDSRNQMRAVLVDSKKIEMEDEQYLLVNHISDSSRMDSVLVELPTEDGERVWVKKEDFSTPRAAGAGNDSQ